MADGRTNPNRPSDDDLAAAIDLHGGAVSRIADHFRVPRTTVNDWIHKSRALRQRLTDARESLIDEAEASLATAVRGGQPWAVCFALKTQGKRRGWTERADIVSAGAVSKFIEDAVNSCKKLGLPVETQQALGRLVTRAAAKRFPEVPQ